MNKQTIPVDFHRSEPSITPLAIFAALIIGIELGVTITLLASHHGWMK